MNRKSITFNKFSVEKRQLEGEFKDSVDVLKMFECITEDLENSIMFEKSNRVVGNLEGSSKIIEKLENACQRNAELEKQIDDENNSLKKQIMQIRNSIMQINTSKLNIHLKVCGKKIRLTPRDLYSKTLILKNEKMKKIKSLQPEPEKLITFKRSKVVYFD
jgi:hypothetical protein